METHQWLIMLQLLLLIIVVHFLLKGHSGTCPVLSIVTFRIDSLVITQPLYIQVALPHLMGLAALPRGHLPTLFLQAHPSCWSTPPAFSHCTQEPVEKNKGATFLIQCWKEI